MLWSATNIRDSSCPRRGLRLRQGKRGPSWEGYRVGSYTHDALHEKALNREPQSPAKAGLTALQIAQADSLLANAKEMGLPEIYPDTATFEESYLVEILNRSGEIGEIQVAPSWAVRGKDWDPGRAGDKTFFRLQPDVWYFDPEKGPSVVRVDDYKTGLGMSADSSISSDTQVVGYSAIIGLLTHATEVEFTLWNIRWKQGQQIRKTTEEWVAEARRLWGACWLIDQIGEKELDDDFRPAHSRCQTCPFFGKDGWSSGCWPSNGDDEPMEQSERELYRAAQWHQAKATEAKAALNEVLRQRTEILELGDGTILGPHKREGLRWEKGVKAEALQEVAKLAGERGEDLCSYFKPDGPSLKAWVEALPGDIRAAVEPYTKRSTTSTYITTGTDDFVSALKREI